MTRDIFQLSRLATLHFLLVENIQPSFCTPSCFGLVFASQVGKLLLWQRRKFLICIIITEKIMRNGKLGKFPWLNSAIVNYKERQRLQAAASAMLC